MPYQFTPTKPAFDVYPALDNESPNLDPVVSAMFQDFLTDEGRANVAYSEVTMRDPDIAEATKQTGLTVIPVTVSATATGSTITVNIYPVENTMTVNIPDANSEAANNIMITKRHAAGHPFSQTVNQEYRYRSTLFITRDEAGHCEMELLHPLYFATLKQYSDERIALAEHMQARSGAPRPRM
jgi:hypothetical protein